MTQAFSPLAERTKGPLLAHLRAILPARGEVLELASGTGQQVAHFARALPDVTWQPSERSAAGCASIAAWCAGLANVRPPLAIDVAQPWPEVGPVGAVLALDVVHVISRAALDRLLAAAARVLAPGGVLCASAPFTLGHVARPSHAALAAWTIAIDAPTIAELAERAARAQLAVAATHDLGVGERTLVVLRGGG